MNKELIIDSNDSEVIIALLEEKKLVELNKERNNNNYSVGDIYLGKVRKVIPGLNAAFIEVGYEKDAFLHYLDLGPQILTVNNYVKSVCSGKLTQYSLENFPIEKEIEKTGKITNILSPNQNILIQIAKEPISNKGPRVTSEISFAGRYLVMIPFQDKISISQKIKSSDERNRLKRLIQSIKPKNVGIIIRTVAEGHSVAELDADLNDLMTKWDTLSKNIKVNNAPTKAYGELNRTSAILRDLLNDSFNSIVVNDNNLFEEVKSYVKSVAPDKMDIVKLYKGKLPIFEFYGIEKQIKSSFGKVVSIKSGSYLIIEHTEAMHVIDVNSGHRMSSDNDQEKNAMEVNIEAANEVARQLRLRDMGGIIVVDFIDMHLGLNRRLLYDKLKEVMRYDRAKHNILPPSKFGLVQITRQRVRPEMNIQTVEKCPMCDGSGEIKASILFTDELENNIKYLVQEINQKTLKLAVHPFIYAYLTKGFISIKMKWALKYKRWIKIIPMSSYHFLESHFYDEKDEEIKI